jgi:hypothetical protein
MSKKALFVIILFAVGFTLVLSRLWQGDLDQELRFSPGGPLDATTRSEVVSILQQRLKLAKLVTRFDVVPIGDDGIEVRTTGADEDTLRRIRRLVTSPGTLEFAELADSTIHAGLIDQVQTAQGVIEIAPDLLAEWVPIFGEPNGGLPSVGLIEKTIHRERTIDGQPVTELLVLYRPDSRLTDEFLVEVQEGNLGRSSLWNSLWTRFHTVGQPAPALSRPALSFRLSPRGGVLMRDLTSRLSSSNPATRGRMAVLLDGKIWSAPIVNAVIGESGVLDGDFSTMGVQEFVASLKSGRLPVFLHTDESRGESLTRE